YRSFLIVTAAILVTGLWLVLERTSFGSHSRAAFANLRMAQSVGINTSRLFTLSFALGSGLAALGGGLGADIIPIDPNYALANLVYFLIVVSVGGLGSIRGPFVAALLLGTADTAFKYLVPELGAFFIYALTMAVLLWRPRGLFWLVRWSRRRQPRPRPCARRSAGAIASGCGKRCRGSPPSARISFSTPTWRWARKSSPPSCLRSRSISCSAMLGSSRSVTPPSSGSAPIPPAS